MMNSALRYFDDPEEFQKFIRGGRARIFVSARGKYQGELARIDLPRILMQRFWQSLPAVVHVKIDPRPALIFLSDAQQSPFVHSGASLGPEEICCPALGDEHHVRYPAGGTLSSCSMTAADLAFFGRMLTGRELHAPPANRVIRPQPNLMSRLRRVHSEIVSLAANTPDILAVPEVEKAVEQALIRAAVACLADTDEMDKARVNGAGGRAMRRFEELLEARPDEPLYIPEICAAAGVGERTLRSYCQEHLGMSPHRYLFLRRMNLARRALVRADAKATTVTGIATQYGFGELGRFAVSYRAMFGESPSATLRGRQRPAPPRNADFPRPDSASA
ncbi:MAG TPA: helix-turn-helix domain-containing protein [Acetobacteraceae bacterium]|jgi:AraC-like DNA-binding protein|nr:helix-turn-helix domain-containing protein [Acetobacteraceae bacterium]